MGNQVKRPFEVRVHESGKFDEQFTIIAVRDSNVTEVVHFVSKDALYSSKLPKSIDMREIAFAMCNLLNAFNEMGLLIHEVKWSAVYNMFKPFIKYKGMRSYDAVNSFLTSDDKDEWL